jgi:RNA-directed DNA polymerase
MFTEDLWNEWVEKESNLYQTKITKDGRKTRKYHKKGYTHFDNRIWFPTAIPQLKRIISNPDKVAKHDFFPFLKMIVKTPRYKYQEDTKEYALEVKPRPISYAAHRDSLILGFYSFALTKKYEAYIKDNGFGESILAYRSDLGESNIQFAKKAFDEVRRRKECVAIALDITGYFDNIDHKILKESWQEVIGVNLPPDQYKIYKTLTRYNYVNKHNFLKHFGITRKRDHIEPANLLELIGEYGDTTAMKMNLVRESDLVVTNNKVVKGRYKGIPQGSAISALLSNIYLLEYDRMMYKMSGELRFYYRRYCDDIILICDPSEAKAIREIAIKQIQDKFMLKINEKKEEIIAFKVSRNGKIRGFNQKKIESGLKHDDRVDEQKFYKPLQYLGFEFNGQDIHIRSTSLSRYFRKMKARIEKTVKMAHSPNSKSEKIFKEQLFHRYSHLGKRNFISYAYNAGKATYKNADGTSKEGMDSPAIKRQLKRHFSLLINNLMKKNNQRYRWKYSRNEKATRKVV